MAEIFDAYWLGYQEPHGQTLQETPDFIDYVTLFLAGPTEESKVTTSYLCKVYGEEQIKQWVKEVRAQGTKVLLSFIDNESAPWSKVDMDTFAASAKEVLDQWGLDGFDIDAESGMPPEEFVPRFVALAEALDGVLDGKTLTYTCYEGCSPGSNDYEILSKIKDMVSWVNLMAYWNQAGTYIRLFEEYASLVGDEKVAFGVKPGYEGEDQSTLLKAVEELSAWNPKGGSKAGMMMFGTNRDNPEFTKQPEWTYAKAIQHGLS
jgi:GH18 family chitinase